MKRLLLVIGAAAVAQTIARSYLDIIGMPGVLWPSLIEAGAAGVAVLLVLGMDRGIKTLMQRGDVTSSDSATQPVTGAALLSREALRNQHRLLLFGMTTFWLVAVGLTFVGIAPLLSGNGIPDAIPAAICSVLLLAAWFWARPKVPRMAPTMTSETYWRDGRAAAAGALLIFLLEGGSTFAALWTLISGSWLTAFVSLLGIVGIALSGPDRQERRSRQRFGAG